MFRRQVSTILRILCSALLRVAHSANGKFLAFGSSDYTVGILDTLSLAVSHCSLLETAGSGSREHTAAVNYT